jgi:HK97 family phage major capsid protein
MHRMSRLYWPLAALIVLALGVTFAPADDGCSIPIPALGLIVTAGLSPKVLMEERGKLIKQAKDIVDKADKEGRDLSPEEDKQFADMLTDADECKRALDAQHAQAQAIAQRRERIDQHNEEIKNAGGIDFSKVRGSVANPHLPGAGPATPEDHALAIQGWFINQYDRSDLPLTQAHIDAAQRVGMRLNARDLVINLDRNYHNVRAGIMNSLKTTEGGSGGYLRPDAFAESLETAMLWFGGMLQVAEVMRTDTAAPFPWPTGNDTSNSGRQIGEAKPVAELDPSFAQMWMYSYKFTSDEVLVSHELLRDTPFNLASLIGSMLGERLGRIKNTKFTTGSGAGTPYGIVNASPVGKTTASAVAITSDELLDLMHSVDKAYRDQPGVGWMFHDQVALALRKLKDSDGRYHWVDGMDAGQPNSLFTKPVQINNDMASSIASEAITALFGQFTKYKVREVGVVRVRRLIERHAENDQEAFIGFQEADGRLLDAGGHPIKSLKQAT